jgi:ribosomal protein L7/L12
MFAASRLERKIDRLERKLDLIIKHLGIAGPKLAFGFTEIDELIQQGKKIQAIKVYREFDRAASLKEAKDAIEERERQVRYH